MSASVECLVYAIDLRGHGDTITGVADDEFDLSAERLANDILEVVDKLLGIILAGLGEPVNIIFTLPSTEILIDH